MHNRECPKCGSIGEWNWADEKKRKMLPNGEYAMVKVMKEGEDAVKCSKCGHKFEPHAHAKIEEKLRKLKF